MTEHSPGRAGWALCRALPSPGRGWQRVKGNWLFAGTHCFSESPYVPELSVLHSPNYPNASVTTPLPLPSPRAPTVMRRLNKISFPSNLAFVFCNQNALQAPVDSTFQVRVGHGKPLPRHFTVDNVWLIHEIIQSAAFRCGCCFWCLGSTSFSLPTTPPLLATFCKPSPGKLGATGGEEKWEQVRSTAAKSLCKGEKAVRVQRAREVCPCSRKG